MRLEPAAEEHAEDAGAELMTGREGFAATFAVAVWASHTTEGVVMKSRERFLRDLGSSRSAVNEFAALQKSRGVSVWLPPQSTTPNDAERWNHCDSGDLMVQMRVEHKVRGFQFTSRKDFPFKTVIVDECYKVDAKQSDPVLAYIIENSDGSRVAVVYGYTRPHWSKERRFDPSQNRECDFYTVPLERVRFCNPDEVF